MKRSVTVVFFAALLAACASMPEASGRETSKVIMGDDYDGFRVEHVEVDHYNSGGGFAWRAKRFVIHNRRAMPLCFAVILQNPQGNLGYWDKRAVLIPAGGAGIVAEAKSSAGNYVFIGLEDWDYFWTNNPSECVI